MSEQVSVAPGDRVLVTRFVGGDTMEPPEEYEVFTEGPDSVGDIRVKRPGSELYIWAREWTKKEAEPEPTDEVEWNPRDIQADETVWVYEYYHASEVSAPATNADTVGYDVCTAQSGHVDTEGDMMVKDGARPYARKWRRPDPEPATEPEPVKVGDWVKVTGVLSAASERYRGAMVGSIRQVQFIPPSGQGINVDITTEEYAQLNFDTPSAKGVFITEYEKVDPPTDEVEWNPEVTAGTMVWVYEYEGDASQPTNYHQRLASGGYTPNAERLWLRPVSPGTLPPVAKRWTLPGPDAEPWNPAVSVGAKVRVYEYHSRLPLDGNYDVRVTRATGPDYDGDLALEPEHGSPTYAKRWMLDEIPYVRESEETEPNWGVLIAHLREVMDEHANDPNSGDAWCEEYESTIQDLFGWVSNRVTRHNYNVRVRLRREVEADDWVNSDVFGGEDDVAIDPDNIRVEGVVTITVEGCEGAPDDEAVGYVLDSDEYRYDSFEILEATRD